jgi:tetratricopeptide (TPR) repeat protein
MPTRVFTLVLACCAASIGYAEPTLLDAGYRQMYNLQFADAHRTFDEYQRLHPDDPMGPASDAAAYLFTEFDRLHILQSEFFTHDEHFVTDHKLTPDPALKQKFDAVLERAVALADRTPQDPDARFASVLCHGLRSDYQALIEKRYVTSFKEMKTARTLAEQLLASNPKYYDAWVAVGVENYMLSIKPLPIRWLLRMGGGETDRGLGLEKLRITAEKGHYLLPFARLLLAVAALREHNNDGARDILEDLAKEFPHNQLYVQELARL